MSLRAVGLLLLLPAPLLLTACITRQVRQDVYHKGRVDVFLRSDKRITSVVQKNYDHPVNIAPVRIAHILSRLDVRKPVSEGNHRVPAVPTELLYSVADGVSRAFSRAGPNQEVVVMAIRKQRRLAVLDDDYLTSFVAYVRGDRLFIHLSRTDWLVPEKHKNQKLPQPRVGENPTKLRIYPSTGMAIVDPASVSVAWRDPIFEQATRTKILPSGEVVRKTILLESPSDESTSGGESAGPEEATPQLPPGITPEQLRALANLEEQRLAGKITEAEYQKRQQEILAGKSQ